MDIFSYYWEDLLYNDWQLNNRVRHSRFFRRNIVHRELTTKNIDESLSEYLNSIESVGASIEGKRGIELFQSIKRDKTGSGPYPGVSLFEASNRIMTDLVILYSVKWILKNSTFPFDKYVVEYGNEDKNDIGASNGVETLSGEAFNVAQSFFQGKKSAMLRKLRKQENDSKYKLILVNSDAVNSNYTPKLNKGEYLLLVNIARGEGKIMPDNGN